MCSERHYLLRMKAKYAGKCMHECENCTENVHSKF